jgi:hypothetical protein
LGSPLLFDLQPRDQAIHLVLDGHQSDHCLEILDCLVWRSIGNITLWREQQL